MSCRSASIESQDEECFKIASLFSPFREKKGLAIDEDTWAKFNEIMTCPICLDVLKEPIFLRCSHRFCKQCMQTVLRVCNTKSCPTCQGKLATRRDLFLDKPIQQMINQAVGDLEVFQQKKNDAEDKEMALIMENARWIKNRGKRDRSQREDDETANMIKMYKCNSGEDTRINLQPSSTDQESDPLMIGIQTGQIKKTQPRRRRTKKEMQQQRQLQKGNKDNLYIQIEIRKLSAGEYIPSIEFNMVRICLSSHMEKVALFIAGDLNINFEAVHLYIKNDPKLLPIQMLNIQAIMDINSTYWADKEEPLVSKDTQNSKFKEQPFVRFVRESRRRRIIYYFINFEEITTL